MASFPALEIRILPQILHEIKNDYAECYLLFLKNTHKSMKRWPWCTWCSGECCLTVTSNNITGPSSALVLRFKNDSPSQNQEFSIVENLCKREVACLLSDCQDSLVHGFIIYACFSGSFFVHIRAFGKKNRLYMSEWKKLTPLFANIMGDGKLPLLLYSGENTALVLWCVLWNTWSLLIYKQCRPHKDKIIFMIIIFLFYLYY